MELTSLINFYGLLSKAHNCDYLELNTLSTIPKYGINGVNIAPEYGIAETKAIISLCEDNGLEDELNSFYALSHKSNKWDKWLNQNLHCLKIKKLFYQAIIFFHQKNLRN